MNRAGQFPPPPPAPQEFNVEPEAAENEAWDEAALAGTIAVFDAATAEEARHRRDGARRRRWTSGGVQSGSVSSGRR